MSEETTPTTTEAGLTPTAESDARHADLTPDMQALVSKVFGDTVEPAAAPVPAPQEPEKPVEEAPKLTPDAERVAARIAAAKRAEQRAAEERKAIADAQAQVEKTKAELADLVKLAEQVKAAKASPSKALELMGLSPKEFLETLATENEPGSIAAREVAREAAEREKLAGELAELKKQLAEEKQRVESAKVEQRRRATEEAFIAKVESDAAKYPHLLEEYTPEETVAEGYRILNETVGHDERGRPITRLQAFVAEHGSEPSDDDVAEFLEHQAKQRAQIRRDRLARIGKAAPAAVPGNGKSGDQSEAQPDRGQSPRTLTSRAASEKASAQRPWSQEAADEESIRILSQALKAG